MTDELKKLVKNKHCFSWTKNGWNKLNKNQQENKSIYFKTKEEKEINYYKNLIGLKVVTFLIQLKQSGNRIENC